MLNTEMHANRRAKFILWDCVFWNAFRFDLISPHKKLYSRCNRNPVGSDSRHRKQQSMKPGSRLKWEKRRSRESPSDSYLFRKTAEGCLRQQIWSDDSCSVTFRRKYTHECSSLLSKWDVNMRRLDEDTSWVQRGLHKLVRIHLEKGSERDECMSEKTLSPETHTSHFQVGRKFHIQLSKTCCCMMQYGATIMWSVMWWGSQHAHEPNKTNSSVIMELKTHHLLARRFKNLSWDQWKHHSL